MKLYAASMLLFLFLSIAVVATAEDCKDDEWVSGPFYIVVAISYEEPDYYPPQGYMPVELCPKNGMIRVPKGYWKETGRNLLGNKPKEG